MLVEREIHGFRMLLEDQDPGISAELLEHGTREGEAPHLVSELVQADWICMEIGANLGFYALMEALKGARIYAIEPVPRCLDILRQNITLNGVEDLVSVHELAIGNGNRRAAFKESPATNWGRMAQAKAITWEHAREIEVMEMTLDSFVAAEEIERVDLLRFDVEGYEAELVEGAQETLRQMPTGSWMFAEFHPRCFDDPMIHLLPAIQNVLDHGFEPRHLISGGTPRDLPEEDFAAAICTLYLDDAPDVLLQKK